MGAIVLYYHRIYPKNPASDVTLPLFEWEMRYLKKRYYILSLHELVDFIKGGLALNKPLVAITFDDGWFDNFVYAYPVLKKYGIKATIFVATSKIRKGGGVRPTLEDCWNKNLNIDKLQQPERVQDGFTESPSHNLQMEFLTWEELRIMQKSGVFDIQSHGVEHRKAFSGDEIRDFSAGNPGLAVRSATSDVRPGVPIYPFRSSLSTRIFYPDPALSDHLACYVRENGGEIFVRDKKFKAKLFAEVERFKGTNHLIRSGWETESEMRERVIKELAKSRDTIYAETGIKPVHFCWPWGEYNDAGNELAKEAGYIACYTTKAGGVYVGTNQYKIPRISARGSKIKFIKRGQVYSHPLLTKVYQCLSGRH